MYQVCRSASRLVSHAAADWPGSGNSRDDAEATFPRKRFWQIGGGSQRRVLRRWRERFASGSQMSMSCPVPAAPAGTSHIRGQAGVVGPECAGDGQECVPAAGPRPFTSVSVRD
jgi:hypothetical protein